MTGSKAVPSAAGLNRKLAKEQGRNVAPKAEDNLEDRRKIIDASGNITIDLTDGDDY